MKRKLKWKRIIINNKKTNYFISNDGKVVNSNTGRILTNMFLDGQYRVHLQLRGNNNQLIDTHRSVAKLMLKTFKNIDQGQDEVLYFKDEDPGNLTLNNIEYISIDDYYIKKRMHIFKLVDDHLVLINDSYDDEIWKPLILDDLVINKFHISNYGRMINIITGNFLNPTISDGIYPYYSIRVRPNGSKKSIAKRITVHTIVAKLFIYNDDPINKTIVHHKDNNINNYKYDNLEWTTPSMNLKYAVDDGLILIGDSAKTAIINKETAIKICEMIDLGYKTSEIVSTLGVSRNIIRHIRDGSSWKSVSKDYNFIINKDYVKDLNLDVDSLIKLISDGYNYDEINKMIKISKIDYYNISKSIKNRTYKSNEKKINNIESIVLKLFNNKLSADDISDITGLTKNKIDEIISNNYHK